MCQTASGNTVMICTLRLCWLNMGNKQLWRSKKIQFLPRQTFEGGKNRNRSFPVLYKNYCLYKYKDRIKCQSCETSLPNKRPKFKFKLGTVSTNDIEQQFPLQQRPSLCKKLSLHFKSMWFCNMKRIYSDCWNQVIINHSKNLPSKWIYLQCFNCFIVLAFLLRTGTCAEFC